MKHLLILLLAAVCLSCSPRLNESKPSDSRALFIPDYSNVTFPVNIAPPVFRLEGEHTDARMRLLWTDKNGKTKVRFFAEQSGDFTIKRGTWRRILASAAGSSITVTVYEKREGTWHYHIPFKWNISTDRVDPYLAYRLIDPGYALWGEMGIYQRCVENYTQTAIYDNRLGDGNCANCHSFCMQDPDKLVFHLRNQHGGTMITDGALLEKLNTKTPKNISALVYPSWHPTGRYVAFSTNSTKQAFHFNSKNRIEVFDLASDVVVYDVEKHEVVTCPELSASNFETFPTFSPDGRHLYFCTADSIAMPQNYEKVKYRLCRIDFDPENRTFGREVDTLVNCDKSVSFPRVSPDGQFLAYTLSSYGNFSIWHQDADLYLLDLESGESKALTQANSSSVESYHAWSSNSRWLVFSSRRGDGLYTRPYFVHIDKEGNDALPFVLPQKRSHFYEEFLKSFNIPEMIKGRVTLTPYKAARKARRDPGINLSDAD